MPELQSTPKLMKDYVRKPSSKFSDVDRFREIAFCWSQWWSLPVVFVQPLTKGGAVCGLRDPWQSVARSLYNYNLKTVKATQCLLAQKVKQLFILSGKWWELSSQPKPGRLKPPLWQRSPRQHLQTHTPVTSADYVIYSVQKLCTNMCCFVRRLYPYELYVHPESTTDRRSEITYDNQSGSSICRPRSVRLYDWTNIDVGMGSSIVSSSCAENVGKMQNIIITR